MSEVYEVGALVQSEARPEWGVGQVQSIIGRRVTVNFENAGRQVIEGDAAGLKLVRPDWT